MVDALRLAGRLLVPGGPVIDLHPTAEPAHVEIETGAGTVHVGDLTEDGTERTPSRRHADADAALAALVQAGTVAVDARREIAFRRYADSPAELQQYLAETRTHSWLSDDTRRQAESVMGAHRTAVLWLREQVSLSRLRFIRS